jgi:hypothetical protein
LLHNAWVSSSRDPQVRPDRLTEQVLARLRKYWRAGEYPLDDPSFVSQLNEMWAIERLNQRAQEERREDEVRRQAFAQGQICAHVSAGCTRGEAARLVGVRPETVSRWCLKDGAFAASLKDAEARQYPSAQRPRRAPESAKATVVELLAQGLTRSQAAAGSGISRQTFYTWLGRLPEFRAAVLAAEIVAEHRPGRPAS